MKTWICTTMTNLLCPTLGAARLYPYVKKQGKDVVFKDLNQDTYFKLLSKEYLSSALERIEYSIDSVSRNKFLREDIGAVLLHSSDNALRQLAARAFLRNNKWSNFIKNTGLLRKPLYAIAGSRINPGNIVYALLSEKEFILSEIERSRKIIDEQFFNLDPETFLENFVTLLCGKAIIDAAYFPAQLDLGLGFYGTAFGSRAGDILRSTEDDRYNYLIPYYRNELVPELEKDRPGIVGISMTCMSELVPAFTLARTVKSVDPEIHVTLGGALVTELSHRFAANESLWEIFDSLVVGPGEYAFTDLIDKIENNGELSEVPNIIYREKSSIKQSGKLDEFDINEACTPEFDSVRPGSVLSLETSSSCYWGKCIFCYYPRQGTVSLDPGTQKKRVRRMELVLDDIRNLKERYNPLAIGFTDSSLHPNRIKAIAGENLKSKNPVKFFALFRLEKHFKSREFCRELAKGGFMGGHVGLESGSQRVNDIINKGVDLKDSEQIIRNFAGEGVLLHLFSIIGTPGETDADAQMTREFIERCHRELKLDWMIYPLYVLEHGPIAQRYEEFGLELTALPEDFLVQSMGYRGNEGLTQEESMGLSISFTESLKKYMHPLNGILDVETLSIFLLAQMAKGIPPEKVRRKN